MRILIATGIFPPEIGGPATYTKLLLEKLPEDFLAKVLTYGEAPAGDADRVFRVSRRLPKGLRHLIYFIKAIQLGRNADIIFAQDPISAGLPAMLAAKLSKKKFVLKIVGDYAWEQGVQRFGVKELPDEFQKKRYGLPVKILRFFQQFTAKNADLLIVPSEYLKKIVLGWGVESYKIRVIYNGIDLPELKSSVREKLIISVGRLVPWKGFEILLEVFSGLIKDFPDWKLVIIGDGPELNKLKVKSEKLKVLDKVIFTGALSKSELNAYLSRASIFALNTGYEGFSHQIIEAMGAGLPVLTTKVGGNSEVIESGKNGLLAEYNNIQSFSLALKKLMTDSRLREKLSETARNTAKNFSKEKMLRELMDLLKKL
ncbi:MAG: glycosyltransferase family 4 protein [Candidatus Harrisonbacteria bacterium]|nr:glycosyltransferase family 4 protein [Candidatus Harrisonbacteria bacterium]